MERGKWRMKRASGTREEQYRAWACFPSKFDTIITEQTIIIAKSSEKAFLCNCSFRWDMLSSHVNTKKKEQSQFVSLNWNTENKTITLSSLCVLNECRVMDLHKLYSSSFYVSFIKHSFSSTLLTAAAWSSSACWKRTQPTEFSNSCIHMSCAIYTAIDFSLIRNDAQELIHWILVTFLNLFMSQESALPEQPFIRNHAYFTTLYNNRRYSFHRGDYHFQSLVFAYILHVNNWF